MGPDEIYDAFVDALGTEDCEDITEQLKTAQVNETDIEGLTEHFTASFRYIISSLRIGPNDIY